MAEQEQVLHHDVHVYTQILLKVCNVPGETDAERIENAERVVGEYIQKLEQRWGPTEGSGAACEVVYAADAEERSAYLVDDVKLDPEGCDDITSRFICGDGLTEMVDGKTPEERAFACLAALVAAQKAGNADGVRQALESASGIVAAYDAARAALQDELSTLRMRG